MYYCWQKLLLLGIFYYYRWKNMMTIMYCKLKMIGGFVFWGHPQMTSRNFGQFLTPIVTLFITKALVLPLQNPWPPPPFDRDVIYGRPLWAYVEVFWKNLKIERKKMVLVIIFVQSYNKLNKLSSLVCILKRGKHFLQSNIQSQVFYFHTLEQGFSTDVPRSAMTCEKICFSLEIISDSLKGHTNVTTCHI